MTTKRDKLKVLLEYKLDYKCDVWFSMSRPQGWMFKTDKTYEQRLGYNYAQADRFIRDNDWEWLQSRLHEGFYDVQNRERIMERWSFWTSKIAEGFRGSAARDWFESLLDCYDEEIFKLKCNRPEKQFQAVEMHELKEKNEKLKQHITRINKYRDKDLQVIREKISKRLRERMGFYEEKTMEAGREGWFETAHKSSLMMDGINDAISTLEIDGLI